MPATETLNTPRPYRRRPDSIAVHVTLDLEAFEILRRYCLPGTKGTGRLIGRLLYEHAARVEERQRLQALRQLVLTEEEETRA